MLAHFYFVRDSSIESDLDCSKYIPISCGLLEYYILVFSITITVLKTLRILMNNLVSHDFFRVFYFSIRFPADVRIPKQGHRTNNQRAY